MAVGDAVEPFGATVGGVRAKLDPQRIPLDELSWPSETDVHDMVAATTDVLLALIGPPDEWDVSTRLEGDVVDTARRLVHVQVAESVERMVYAGEHVAGNREAYAYADWLAGQTVTLRDTLLAALGVDPDRPDAARIAEAEATVTEFAKAYTRGVGFDLVTGEPNAQIAAVIEVAGRRYAANPEQTRRVQGTALGEQYVGPATTEPARFDGWTLGEQAVLNRYRRRMA